MPTYSINPSFAGGPEAVCDALRALVMHRQGWGITISSIGFAAGKVTVTLTPPLTQAQKDHLGLT